MERFNKKPAPNIVYTKLGSSGSNYSRVNIDCVTNQAQHRMPSVRIHGTLAASVATVTRQ